MKTTFIAIAFFVALISILYYLFWVKIETVAKPLLAGIMIIATLFVGFDLLITVFSYGTWAVFFKKLVGSIIIVLPIYYVLSWLEQIKKRKKIFNVLNSKSLPKESFLRKSIFKNPLESNIGTRGILVAVLLSFIIPIGLMIVFNDYSIVFNGIALLVFFIGYGFYKAFNEKKEFVSAKEVAYEEVERLVSIGWNREVAIKKIFSENSKESLANPLKEVQTNVEKSLKQKEKEKTNYSIEDLKWEYGFNDKEPNQRPCE